VAKSIKFAFIDWINENEFIWRVVENMIYSKLEIVSNLGVKLWEKRLS